MTSPARAQRLIDEFEEAASFYEGYSAALATPPPQPPSLKEQALAELGDAYDKGKIDDTTYDTIRKALEAQCTTYDITRKALEALPND